MAVPLALMQGLNAVTVALAPTRFAIGMGLPLEAVSDAAWVSVYGLRTAFISLLVTTLLVRRDLHALKWTAAVALVMPLGDAFLTHQAGAPTSLVAKHASIFVYLLLTTIALFVAARGRGK
jgi:hypothetical protein